MRWGRVSSGVWAGRPVIAGDQFLIPHSQGNEIRGPAAEYDAFNPRPLPASILNLNFQLRERDGKIL